MNRIAINFSLIFGARIVSAGLYFLFTFSLMKLFSAEEYGYYSYYYSVMGLLSVLMGFGVDETYITYMSREVDGEKELEYLGAFLVLKLLLCLVLLLIAFGILWSGDFVLFFCVVGGVLWGATESLKPPLQARKEFLKIALFMPFRNLFLLVILICLQLASRQISVAIVLGIVCLVNVITFLLFLAFTNKDLSSSIKSTVIIGTIKKILWDSRLLLGRDLSMALMARMEIFIITMFSSYGYIDLMQLGYYTGAYTLCMLLPIITTSLTRILLPEVAGISDVHSIHKFVKSIKKSLLIIIPFATLFLFAVQILIRLWFDSKYEGSVPVFYFIVIGIVINFYANTLSLLFYREGGLHIVLRMTVLQLFLNTVLDAFFVPLLGAIGGGIAMALVRCFGLVFILLQLRKNGMLSKNY